MKKTTLLILALAFTTASFSQLLYEGFDDITTLTSWDKINVSGSIGTTTWFQGNSTVFASQNGASTSYIGANFNATTGNNTISNWLILPTLSLKDGDELTFYTRTSTGSIYPDRLQVRLSNAGATSTPPASVNDLGSYTILLSDINEGLTVGGYPDSWTLQTVIISGLGATAVDARLAFRYFVANGGPSGTSSNFIGIDNLTVTSTLSVDEFSINSFSNFYDKESDILTLKSDVSAFSGVEIYNLLGQNVVSRTLSNTTETIQLSSLQDGVYIVKVLINGNSKSFKLLKQ